MTALAKLEQPKSATPDVNEFSVMKETATMLVKTGFLPQSIKTPEQAMAIILTGRELGIGTMAALNTINVIQGKPTVSPQLMLALIERSGQLENIEIKPDDASVVCTMKRKGRSAHSEWFGQAEATAMQLHGKDNYKKQAQTMYRWRAVAACARVVFPDVILGLYSPDEMGADVNEEGELITPTRPAIEIAQAKTPITIDAEPEQTDEPDEGSRKAYELQIAVTCKELNTAKDDIKWTKTVLTDYANQFFDGENLTSTDELTDEQLQFLAEDLQLRLDALR